MTVDATAYIHPSATIDAGARIGPRTRIWHLAHLRAGASVGEECIVGRGVYVGAGVQVGNRCKLENYALVFEGASLGDGVFIGPGAVLANDRTPRAMSPEGKLLAADDWVISETHIATGATIGARAVVVPPVTIGEWSMIAAGAIVTRDVPPHGLVVGGPARLAGYVCWCGHRVGDDGTCPSCGRTVRIP